MSQQENKPKLSDVTRQTNTDKSKRYAATMIPPPPLPKQPVLQVTESAPLPAETTAPESLLEKIEKGESDFAEGRGTVFTVDELKEKLTVTDPAADKSSPAKTTRARRSGSVTIDDVVNGEPPKGEPYPRQVRISEKHHKLLRKLAFTHEKTQNHLLYNLLDLLEQADQREQQKGN